jgi:hypothetical protein
MGFVLASTAGTGLAGVVLVYQPNGDTLGLCLVGDVLPDVPVRPQADLLLGLGRHALASRHITDIAYGECTRYALNGIIHHGTRDRMLNIAGALLLLSKKAILAPLQPLLATRSLVFAILAGPQCRQALGGVLAHGTQTPPASTLVEVRRLAQEDFLLEVEAIASLPG